MNAIPRASRSPSSQPLTVLFSPAHTLIDEDQIGSEYHWAYKLIHHLALEQNVRIIALTVQSHTKQHLPGVRFVSIDPGGRLPDGNMDRFRFHLRCYAKARQILASGERIDIIHHMLPFGFRATFNPFALLPRRCDPPLIIGPLQPPYAHRGGAEWHVSTPDVAAPVNPTPVRRHLPPLSTFVTTPILSALSTRTLRHATAIVVVSERAARLYGPLAGATTTTETIPIGVDTDEFKPHVRPEHPDSAHDEHPVQVLACGHLVQRKAFDVLLTAMSMLARANLQVHLRLVGDGPERSNLQDLASRLGIEHYVTFVGAVPHSAIAHEYRCADIFCSPSFGEGFATVSLEALASGLPMVATPTGGFRELIGHHQVGTLVRFGAADKLAEALAELVTQKKRRETLSNRTRQVAVREYDWSVIAQRYRSLYDRVAHRGQ